MVCLQIFIFFLYTNYNPTCSPPWKTCRCTTSSLPQLTQPIHHNPNTRMCPCGHVLVSPLPSLVLNTRTRPQGHVLVFGHYILPPGHEEHDPSVMFFVSGMVFYTTDMKTRPQVVFLCLGYLCTPPTTLHHPSLLFFENLRQIYKQCNMKFCPQAIMPTMSTT